MRYACGVYVLFKGDTAMKGRRALLALMLIVQMFAVSMMSSSSVAANPNFDTYPVSSTHANPDSIVSAYGAVWYIQTQKGVSPSGNSIGRMDSSGVITDYSLGSPSSTVGFGARSLIAGPDGNIWFIGTATNVYIGMLNISTGAVTFFYVGGTIPGGDRFRVGR